MYIVGIDIGGTKCAVVLAHSDTGALVDNSGITDKIIFDTEVQRGPEVILAQLADSVEHILDRNYIRPDDLAKIGISCGGPLDSNLGIIKSPPNLPGWDDIHIKEYFEKKFFIPVQLHNDANACALAELKFGAARGYKNAIFLTFGTGMGAGIIINGEIYSGRNDMAGEVGHIRLSDDGPFGYGKNGSFEGFCSGGGIASLADSELKKWLSEGNKSSLSEVAAKKPISAKDVAQAMYSGDELAKKILTISAEYLGRGLSILLDILNPEIIVIGSIFSRNYDFFLPIVMRVINEEALAFCAEDIKIVASQLGDEIGDYAALGIVSD